MWVVLNRLPPSALLSAGKVESDVDAVMLACFVFSCPKLLAMEIHTSDKAINRITGDELGLSGAEKWCLSSLKIEGCSNLCSFTLSSSSLSTLACRSSLSF